MITRHPSIHEKLALSSPTSGGRPVGIVRSRTQATEFSLVFMTASSGQMNIECHWPLAGK
jgi:hypothetical protein